MTKKTEELIIDIIFKILPEIKSEHIPSTPTYKALQNQLQICVDELWGLNKGEKYNLSDIGIINLPYFNMGNINSTNLFALDELIIFNFYMKNVDNYKNVYDLGANIGLHSIILGKLGYNVKSYEPDPIHFKELVKNIKLNNVANKVECIEKAISNCNGKSEFTRIIGNTTGSHISGSKESPYGEMDIFNVDVENIKKIMNEADLIKMDIEGHENQVITSLSEDDWNDTDVILEVGSEKNAVEIFEYFEKLNGIKLFSQSTSWKEVKDINDMPKSHRDGSLFISSKNSVF